MDVDEAMESAGDDMSSGASYLHESTQLAKKRQKRKRVATELAVLDDKSVSTEWQQEIDELFEYYKEVSAHQLNPEELLCLRTDSSVACLLEESSLPYTKLTDEIYKRLKLQDGVTESSVRSLVLHIGKRIPYGISAMDVDELEDESESSLWCWETQDLELLPSHVHGSLSIRRTARKLIHERILVLWGNLSGKDTPKTHGNHNSQYVNAGQVLNLDGIRSLVEKLKKKNDADKTNMEMQSKTKAQALQAIRNAVKDQQKIEHQVQKEQEKKDRELKHMKEKAEKEEKRIERENKRLKKHQEEVERAKKRREKEQAELKRQASIQRQANIMERFLKRKTNNKVESSGGYHLVKATCSISSGNTGELAVAATSTIDCTLSQAKCLGVEELWVAHAARWRELFQNNRFFQWGVRKSPKMQLFHELKLQKSSMNAPSEMMSTTTKEQSSQENTGSLDFPTLLDELNTPSYGNKIVSKATQNSSSSSVWFIKKLLQFDGSHRPSYYDTWRKKSSTVSGRHPFKMDPDLNYEVDSDDEWEEEDPGERLSDFEKDDEETNKHDYKVDDEEETENSFVVPNDYLSEDEGVQYEPLSGKFDDTCSMLSTSGFTVEELNVLLQREKALNSFTEHALKKDRPLVISNLDHGKADLLKSEHLTGILKVEQLCLQALCMRKYPGGPINDVPIDINIFVEDQKVCRASKSKYVASKSVLDLDMPEFVKLIMSCSHGMSKLVELLLGRFPCVSKAQLKKKVREIAEYTNNRWQVKKDILDQYGSALSPDTRGSPICAASNSSQPCQVSDESANSGESSLEPAKISKIVINQTDAQRSGQLGMLHQNCVQ